MSLMKVIVSPAVSRRMRAVPRKHTSAERTLQQTLRTKRLRFQTHIRILGCNPDIVFRLSRVSVFVDGDFWHGRLLIEKGPKALSKSFKKKAQSFWVKKITRNATRDIHQTNRLRHHGWCVMRFWEKDVLKDPCAVYAAIEKRLRQRKRQLKFSSVV
jgi:DNA mismatch endonuclease, patch repair protein